MQEGVKGLLRDKTRPSRIPALTLETVAWVVARTHEAPSGGTTHWTAALMAREAGISASSVHRIWRAHGLQPHRVRQFKLSNDPEFIDKLRDVVGLYVAPPAHAIVLSFDEKSQIQALDRSQPGLPLKKGRAGTMTHDYHSLVDLQAAINRFLAEHNECPKPFVWTADPDKIIAAVRRGHQVLDSNHSHVRLFKE